MVEHRVDGRCFLVYIKDSGVVLSKEAAVAKKKKKSPEKLVKDCIAKNVEELMENPEIKQMVKEMKQAGLSQREIIELIAQSFSQAFLDRFWPERN